MPLSDRDKLSWDNGPPNIYYPEKLPAEAGCWQLIIPRLAEHDSPDDDSLSTSKIFISLALPDGFFKDRSGDDVIGEETLMGSWVHEFKFKIWNFYVMAIFEKHISSFIVSWESCAIHTFLYTGCVCALKNTHLFRKLDIKRMLPTTFDCEQRSTKPPLTRPRKACLTWAAYVVGHRFLNTGDFSWPKFPMDIYSWKIEHAEHKSWLCELCGVSSFWSSPISSVTMHPRTLVFKPAPKQKITFTL